MQATELMSVSASAGNGAGEEVRWPVADGEA
jgi:hypothetical protein